MNNHCKTQKDGQVVKHVLCLALTSAGFVPRPALNDSLVIVPCIGHQCRTIWGARPKYPRYCCPIVNVHCCLFTFITIHKQSAYDCICKQQARRKREIITSIVLLITLVHRASDPSSLKHTLLRHNKSHTSSACFMMTLTGCRFDDNSIKFGDKLLVVYSRHGSWDFKALINQTIHRKTRRKPHASIISYLPL